MSKSQRRRQSGSAYSPLTFINERGIGNACQQQAERLMRQRMGFARSLYHRDLKAHYGCVNAIEFSNKGGEFIASGGDDRRVLLWNTQKSLNNIGKPQYMKGEHNSNIFCLAFDVENKKIFSGGNDEQVIVHDLKTGATLDVFMHEDAVYGLSVDPNNINIFASACDDGRILVYDIRESPSTDPFCLANYTSSMHAVMYNPVDPRLIATANAKEGIGLWDIRKPRSCLLRYGGGCVQQSCMSVRINRQGDQVLALRRRLPPVLYNIHSAQPICEFDHTGYYNSCTMKSCSFAGDKDQYVLSGSDDFNLYMWKIPENCTKRQYVNDVHMVLKGHRSIVNQVRFNPSNHLIISSGVEKIVKVWSPFPMQNSQGSLTGVAGKSDRPVYSHEEYINLVLHSGHVMTHDYSSHSTEEDPRMMAFFDSLVQRELEGCSSEDDLSSSEQELYDRIVQLARSDLSSDNSDTDSPEEVNNNTTNSATINSATEESNVDDDSSFSPFSIAFASVMATQATRGLEESPSVSRNVDNRRNESVVSPSSTVSLNQSVETPESGTSSSTNTPQSTSTSGGNRRSISELIAQKRREMIKQATELRNKKCKRKRTRLISTSDSSDDEGASSTMLSRRKKPTPETPTQGHPNNVVSAQRQLVQLRLKRLQQLRTNILQSDSENSDNENETKKDAQEENAIDEKSNQQSTSDVVNSSKALDSVSATSNSCLSVSETTNSSKVGQSSLEITNNKAGCSKSKDTGEIGPYLHEADLPSQPSTSSQGSCSHQNMTSDRQSTKSQCSETNQPNWTEFKRFKNNSKHCRRQYRKHSQSDNDD